MKQARLHRPFYRNGPSHRDGADVSFKDIVKIFGFRSVTIGKWVTREELQLAANLFFDGFCDLMLILNVPENVISLNGSLSLAFGTGGNPRSCAHYDARQRKLALAKNAGGGALAHEWFHSFDHYISDKIFNLPQKHPHFASETWLKSPMNNTHSLNQSLESCFEAIFLHKNEHSDYVANAIKIDRQLGSFYFSKPQELAARAFEATVQDSSIKNQFLVSGTKQSYEAKLSLYPENNDRKRINGLFQRYFTLLGNAIEAKNSAL
jgi:hypothetical protein